MRQLLTTGGCALIGALLTLAPRSAAAQFAQDNPLDRNDAPPIVTDFGAGRARGEVEADFIVLGAFGGPRRLDRFSRNLARERPKPWTVYGRIGMFNFQNEIEPQYSQGLRLSWRRTGPRLTGRVYIGIHRTFD